MDAARRRSGSRIWRQLTGDQFQERRLADTIATDKANAFGPENDIQVGEKRATVRRGPG
jgi:hypothetical protein